MNTLIDIDNKIKYQGQNYVLLEHKVVVLDDDLNLLFFDLSLNNKNAKIVDITPISNFIGNKYLLVDDEVLPNPDYKDINDNV